MSPVTPLLVVLGAAQPQNPAPRRTFRFSRGTLPVKEGPLRWQVRRVWPTELTQAIVLDRWVWPVRPRKEGSVTVVRTLTTTTIISSLTRAKLFLLPPVTRRRSSPKPRADPTEGALPGSSGKAPLSSRTIHLGRLGPTLLVVSPPEPGGRYRAPKFPKVPPPNSPESRKTPRNASLNRLDSRS